jgi:hypothetical protein
MEQALWTLILCTKASREGHLESTIYAVFLTTDVLTRLSIMEVVKVTYRRIPHLERNRRKLSYDFGLT